MDMTLDAEHLPKPSRVKDLTMRSFGYEWTRFSKVVPEYESWFLRWIAPLRPEFFKGKLVLDAGCGMGRHTYCASKWGAEVVGMDLSSAVYAAQKNLHQAPNVHVLRADIYYTPLRRRFDFVYSIGVIHHLHDPQDGVRKLSDLLKPGGKLLVWVYAKEGNGFAIKFIEPVRRLTTRLPFRTLETLSTLLAIPLYGLSRIARLLRWLPPTRTIPYFLYFTRLSNFRVSELKALVFDILSAPLARYVSSDEIRSWFANARLHLNTLRWVNRNGWTAIGTAG